MIKFKEKKTEGGIQIGTSSLVVIFVILALTVFAVLSLTRVLADDRLSDRSADWVAAYYEADCKAEEILKSINEAVEGDKANAALGGTLSSKGDLASELSRITGGDYDEAAGIVSFTVPINDTISLEVETLISSTPKDGRYYTVTKWNEIFVGEYEIDQSMPVWDGTFE